MACKYRTKVQEKRTKGGAVRGRKTSAKRVRALSCCGSRIPDPRSRIQDEKLISIKTVFSSVGFLAFSTLLSAIASRPLERIFNLPNFRESGRKILWRSPKRLTSSNAIFLDAGLVVIKLENHGKNRILHVLFLFLFWPPLFRNLSHTQQRVNPPNERTSGEETGRK